jgi:hypothetical protein
MIATNFSSVLLNMETWIYQPPHVGYHGKLHANCSLDVIVSTNKFLLLKHTFDLLCTYLKESSHLKCSFQHDNSLGFLDKHICKHVSSIQSIKDMRVLLDLPCHNPSLGFTTKARACKGAGQVGSPGVAFHAHGNARECEGMNLHIRK